MNIAHLLLVAVLPLNTPSDDGDPLQQAIDVLNKVDATRMTVEYRGETLHQVLIDLSTRLPVPVRADWDALRRMGVTDDDRVDFRLSGASGSVVLTGLAMAIGDEIERPVFEVHAGQMVLTSLRATEPMRLMAMYDVRDLLADSMLLKRLQDQAPESKPAAESTPSAKDVAEVSTPVDPPKPPLENPGQAHPGQQAKPNRLGEMPDVQDVDAPPKDAPPTPGERLINVITDHVDPEAWMNFGGSRAKITDQNGVLIVTATPTTHRKLQAALRRLREAVSVTVRVRAAIIDLPRERFESLSRQYDKRSALLASSFMNDSSATIIWKSDDPASIGHPLSIENESREITIRIALTPHVQEPTGVCTIDIDAMTSQPGDRRTLKTTATLDGDDRGAVVELPASKPGDVVRILALLVDRG